MKTSNITITGLILVYITTGLIIGCSHNPKDQDPVENTKVNNPTTVYEDYGCQVHLIKVQGHEYLVAYTESSYGGTCITHAAHCPCQTNK